MTELDHLQNRQSKLLLLFALSFALWQTSTLLVDHFEATGALKPILIGTMIASGLFWFVILVLLFGGLFHRRDKAMHKLAQDEWQKYISATTISASYVGLTAVIGVGVLWTLMVGPLNSEIAFRVLLIVAVVVPLLLSVIMDKLMSGSNDG